MRRGAAVLALVLAAIYVGWPIPALGRAHGGRSHRWLGARLPRGPSTFDADGFVASVSHQRHGADFPPHWTGARLSRALRRCCKMHVAGSTCTITTTAPSFVESTEFRFTDEKRFAHHLHEVHGGGGIG
jgi:hypothetical protein